MVTLPTEAAGNDAMIQSLLSAGMDCARINTAHDSPATWEQMCATVRRASLKTGRGCKVLIDLAGPKLRTGPFEDGPKAVRVGPVRDACGRVARPGEVVLRGAEPARESQATTETEGPARGGTVHVPVPEGWLSLLKPGDQIETLDARGRHRTLKVVGPEPTGGVRVSAERAVYIATGSHLTRYHEAKAAETCTVGEIDPTPQHAEVRPGDRLLLSFTKRVGSPATPASPAIVTCQLPEAFRNVEVGHAVWFDDGKVGTVVRAIERDAAGVPASMDLEVTVASLTGDKIRQDKGINLPQSDVGLAGLTPEDRSILPLIAAHADMVGLSFVQEAREVIDLAQRLRDLGGAHVGAVLKIETKRGFENLPELLLAALRWPAAGVMIARGDLAVECGYERLAEAQEEILWLCEAAHVPVIWATQVLESLAKSGRASRAEVTDAAMAERAECVMLNKGPYVAQAVRFLDGVLQRMSTHQEKKRHTLRALSIAKAFRPQG
jgi:pyruvate kinase